MFSTKSLLINYAFAGKDGLLPACVEENAGVSKTFRILYRNEEITLDDMILFRAHVLVDSNKVIFYSTKWAQIFVESLSLNPSTKNILSRLINFRPSIDNTGKIVPHFRR